MILSWPVEVVVSIFPLLRSIPFLSRLGYFPSMYSR